MEQPLYHELNKHEEKHFWFKARREIIFTMLKKFNLLQKDLKVLEIGAGTGGNLVYFAKYYHNLKAVEYDANAIELAKLKCPNYRDFGRKFTQ